MTIIESVVKYGFIFFIGSALTVRGDTCTYGISHLSVVPRCGKVRDIQRLSR
jgi:hypothetical protein